MKIGKIASCVGGEIVACSQMPVKALEIKKAREIIEMPVYLEDSKKAPYIGKVKNIIGRVEDPFFVIPLSKKSPVSPDKLLNKFVYSPYMKP